MSLRTPFRRFRRSLPAAALAALVLTLGCGGSDSTPSPTVTGFSPASGAVGVRLSVNGTGFSYGVKTVELGGVSIPSANGLVVTDTLLGFVVPDDAVSGLVSVTTDGGTASSAAMFIVTPALSGINPVSGPPGTVVTFTGTGLKGITRIAFDTQVSTIATQTANQITVPVPADVAAGTVVVTLQVDPSYGLPNILSQFTVTP